MERFYVYTLLSLTDYKLYTSFTTNLKNRLQQHARGEVKSTKDRRPLKLIHYEYFINEDDAKARGISKKRFWQKPAKKSIEKKSYENRSWKILKSGKYLNYAGFFVY